MEIFYWQRKDTGTISEAVPLLPLPDCRMTDFKPIVSDYELKAVIGEI